MVKVMAKVWSVSDNLILARDDNKNWYEVNKKDAQVGEEISSSICTPLSETSSDFHEGIKELYEAVYGSKP